MDVDLRPVALGPMLARGDALPPEIVAAAVLHPYGSYARRAPVFLDAEALHGGLLDDYAIYMSQRRQEFGPIHAVSLANVLVGGQGSVALPSGVLVRETVLEYLAHGLTPTGMVRTGPDAYAFAGPVTRVVDAPAVLLQRPWYGNYGHWLVDAAALLALLADTALPPSACLVVGAQESEGLRRVVQDSLGMLRPGLPVLQRGHDETWRFNHLIYVMPVHVPPLFKLPAALRQLRRAFVPGPAAGGRRLFVTRSGALRRLENEAEIIALCTARGFEVVRPELLPVAGQARLFSEAEAVIGVKGAALTNGIFCSPGSALMVLSPSDFNDPFFFDIASQGDMRYGEVFGRITETSRPASHNAFQVAPEKVEAMLDAVMNAMPRAPG